MKLGIVGKGGVGKTTISGLLCQAYSAEGRRVLAVDTDSNPNLAISLGLDEKTANEAPVVPRSLVVGTGDGAMTTAALLAEYGLNTPSNTTLLHAMRVDQPGAGCTCSSHASVRSLLGATIEEADVTLVDMEAGLEHLSRSGGTLAYADILLMVMEPTHKSIMTAARTVPLAKELGIPQVYGIGNKAKLPADGEFYTRVAAEQGVQLAGIVPFHADVPLADRRGTALTALEASTVREAVATIIAFVDSVYDERNSLLAERGRVERRLLELAADN